MPDLMNLSIKSSSTAENFKSFTFRSVPAALHQAWKIAAAAADISMEEFGILALENLVKDILRPSKPEVEAEPESESETT